MQDPKSSKKPDNSYLRYSGLGLQFLLTIAVFGWLGYKMDQWWNGNKPLFIIIMLFLGMIGGFYQFFRAVSK